MSYKPGDSAFFFFGVSNSAGAAANADALPTAALYRNGALDGAVTVTVAGTGSAGGYKGSFTIPGTYVKGDTVTATVSTTVGGATLPPTPVFRECLDGKRVADLNDAAAVTSFTVGGYAPGQDPATLLKADALFGKLLNTRLGKYTYNPSTKVLTLLQDDGTTALGTVTLSIDTNSNITARQ